MTEAELFLWAVKGDRVAADFLHKVTDLAHTWDDLVDRDKPVTDNQINVAFFDALTLSNNAFYARYRAMLEPILINSIINWRVATTLERSEDSKVLPISFILRSSYVDLLTMSACLIGGMNWAEDVGIAARQMVHGEGYDKYLSALITERGGT
jgi:hypothetical protein